MWHKRVALGLAFAAGALLLLSGPGVRAGLWPFRVGFGMFAGALVLGLAATGAALIGLAVPRIRAGAVAALTAALVIGAASAAMPLENLRRVKAHPYINDITTDTEDPPQFSQPRPYERHFAELQRLGYPDLQSLELGLRRPRHSPARAWRRRRSAGRSSRRIKARGASRPSPPRSGSASRTISPCASCPRRRGAAWTCVPGPASAAATSAQTPAGSGLFSQR